MAFEIEVIEPEKEEPCFIVADMKKGDIYRLESGSIALMLDARQAVYLSRWDSHAFDGMISTAANVRTAAHPETPVTRLGRLVGVKVEKY